MKRFHHILLAATALCFGLASCEESNELDTSLTTPPVVGEGVYFSSSLPQEISLSRDNSTFSIVISRTDTASQVTVPLTTTTSSAAYTLPSEAAFQAGEKDVTLIVTYDESQLDWNVYDTLTVSIPDEFATPYGLQSISLRTIIALTWTTLGKATYQDVFWFDDAYEVTLQQQDQNPNIFRLYQPYTEGLAKEGEDNDIKPAKWYTKGEWMQFQIMQPGDNVGGVEITQEDIVVFDHYMTGMHEPNNGGDVYILYPNMFSSLNNEDSWLYNKVVSYQENGLPAVVQFAPYYYLRTESAWLGGWNHTQDNGYITVTFPGVKIADYSVTLDVDGILVDVAGDTYAQLSVALGADVDSVILAPVASQKASAINEAIDAVLAGEVENTVTLTASGAAKVALPYTGKVAVVAITFAEGEAQDADYAKLENNIGVADPNEGWTSLGTAELVDAAVIPFYYEVAASAFPYDVEVQQNDADPTLIRLVDAYSPEVWPGANDAFDYEPGTYLEIIIADADHVYMEIQPTGLSTEEDGAISIGNFAGYYIGLGYDIATLDANNIPFGTYADGVISFPVNTILGSFGTDPGPYTNGAEVSWSLAFNTTVTSVAHVQSNVMRAVRQAISSKEMPRAKVSLHRVSRESNIEIEGLR